MNNDLEARGRSQLLMLAYLCVSKESEASLVRKVQILDRFDLDDVDIAIVCGASRPAVATARLRAKKLNVNKKKK